MTTGNFLTYEVTVRFLIDTLDPARVQVILNQLGAYGEITKIKAARTSSKKPVEITSRS